MLFLAAGMASQAARFLIQADVLPEPRDAAVGHLGAGCRRRSIAGTLLHSLVGYDARPAGMQIVFYVVVLVAIAAGMVWSARAAPSRPRRNRVLKSRRASMVCRSCSRRERDRRSRRIRVRPAVEYGEREIDFKYGVAGKKDEPTAQAASLGFGYGATEWWFTEFYVKGAREGSRSTFDAIEWENKFQLTETGKYPVDVGFIAEFELPHDRTEGNEFVFGPLFQTEFDRLQLNFNPLLTNITRAVEEQRHLPRLPVAGALPLAPKRSTSARRASATWASGTTRRRPSEQSHRLGPGGLRQDRPRRTRRRSCGTRRFLFGVTNASPDCNSGCRPSTSSRRSPPVRRDSRASGGLVAK